MRPLFVFLRVIASLVASAFAALGLLFIGFGVWMVCTAVGPASAVGSLVVLVGFGGWMAYLGARVLFEQSRLVVEWRRGLRRERGLPRATILFR